MYEVTGEHGAFITHFSNFCKSKIDDGWLAEKEDPKKLKETLINIATIVKRCYDKSWHGACDRIEEGSVTDNLRDLFPATKGVCKIECEASPRTFFFVTNATKYRGVFLCQSNIYDEAFREIS